MAPAENPGKKTTVPEGFFLAFEKGKGAGKPQKMNAQQLERFRRGMPGGPKGAKPGGGPGPAKKPGGGSGRP